MASIGAILRSLVLGPTAEGRGRDETSRIPVPKLPEGRVIYAIGDVHGRADCLHRLLERVREDVAATGASRPLLLFLGDYVDRGDESREVIESCATIDEVWPHEAVFLRGNHEDAMLTFMADPVDGAAWLRFGGLSTLMSYGVPNVSESMPENRLREASELLTARVPDSHRSFLENTVLTHVEGNILFCHAGVDPAVDADAQAPRTLMWGEGTDAPGRDWPLIVVHGHVVVDEPVVRTREVNVDTGAYFSGRLTCVRLQDGGIRFLES